MKTDLKQPRPARRRSVAARRPGRSLAAVLAALALVAPTTADARDYDPEFDTVPAGATAGADADRDPAAAHAPRVGAMLAAGAGAGAVGFFCGAIIGQAIGKDGEDSLDGLEEGVIVGSVVGGLLLPLGVHGGNGGRGSLPHVMATSILVGAAGWALASELDGPTAVLATPLFQLGGCAAVEVATMPGQPDGQPQAARPAAAPATIAVGPGLIGGAAAVVVGGRF